MRNWDSCAILMYWLVSIPKKIPCCCQHMPRHSGAREHWGQGTGDFLRFGLRFWELPVFCDSWSPMQGTVDESIDYGGSSFVVFWEQGSGELVKLAEFLRTLPGHHGIRPFRGREAWHKRGVSVSLMGELPVTLYGGELFDGNCASIIPNDQRLLPALWCFCSSPEFNQAVRRIDQALKER